MRLDYEGKRSTREILYDAPRTTFDVVAGARAANKLIHGENRAALNALLDRYAGKIGLVYIDPPFATNTEFRVSAERANSVSSSKRDPIAYRDKLVGPAYIEFLRERLVLLRELLADHGSIYLHIDYKIGHYVKVLMDEVFGAENFRNDITRIKCNPKNFARKGYGNIKDMILFYAKSDAASWHDPRQPFSDAQKTRLFKKIDADGRRYTTVPLHAPGETAKGETGRAWRGIKPPKGRHWRGAPAVLERLDRDGLIEWSSSGVPRKKIYLNEQRGQRMQDIWEFKDPQYPDYPTEKNLNMLKLIVGASSREGDIVLDCFCGSGTTLLAAHQLGRKWIGIDESAQAIEVAANRLQVLARAHGATAYERLVQCGKGGPAPSIGLALAGDDDANAPSPAPGQLGMAA